MARRQRSQLNAPTKEERIGADQERLHGGKSPGPPTCCARPPPSSRGGARRRSGWRSAPPRRIGGHQSCSVRKVSQLETVPPFRPVVNQRVRCAEEPWVKASGTT